MTTNTRTVAEIIETLNAAFEELRNVDTAAIDNADIGRLGIACKAFEEYRKAVDVELTSRVILNGQLVPGVSTKPEIKHRAWSDEKAASELAFSTFGLKAFKLLSPAAIEKLGDEGKALAAVASTKPEAGKKIAY